MFKFRNIKKKLYIAVMCLALSGMAACGRRQEAVISADGEELTEAVKEYDKLSVSTADKFSFEDLKVGNLSYLATEDQVIEELGEPESIKEINSDAQDAVSANEKVYLYDGRSLTFTMIGGAYKLTSYETTNNNDTFSRGIQVGGTFDNVISVYYRDTDCMNNNYYSADKSVIFGKYLYGAYTIDNLESVKETGNVEYGLINFNGYDSLEDADSYYIEMYYFEAPYKSEYASISDDFAQLSIELDKDGKILSMCWYYYPEEE